MNEHNAVEDGLVEVTADLVVVAAEIAGMSVFKVLAGGVEGPGEMLAVEVLLVEYGLE